MGKKYYLLPLLLDYYSISIINNNYGKLPKYPGETARIATNQLTPSPKTNPPCSIEKKTSTIIKQQISSLDWSVIIKSVNKSYINNNIIYNNHNK